MDKIKVLKTIHVPNLFHDLDFLKSIFKDDKDFLLTIMTVEILYENERISLRFRENESLNWELLNFSFTSDEKGYDAFLYNQTRGKLLGEKKVQEMKDEIEKNIDKILNDPKVRVKKLFKD